MFLKLVAIGEPAILPIEGAGPMAQCSIPASLPSLYPAVMEATWTTGQESRYRLGRGFVCVVLACFAGYEFSIGTGITPFIGLTVVLAIVGVIRGVKWGRRLAVAACILLLIVFGVGSVLPARMEGAQMTGTEAPELGRAVVEFVAVVVIALASLHILGRYKQRFRKAWW
jgi:hypothetical protein